MACTREGIFSKASREVYKRDIKRIYRSNPVSEDDLKPYGISFPLQRGSNGSFEKVYSPREQIKSNLRNLLLTLKGERLFNPDYGCDLRLLLFENLDEERTQELAKYYISDSCSKWMPFINVLDVRVKDYEQFIDNNYLTVEVDYNFMDDDSITETIQLKVGGKLK